MLFIILLLGFLTTVYIVLGLYNILFAKRISVANRLQVYTDYTEAYDQEDVSFKEYILSIIGFLGKKTSRKGYMDNKKKSLNQAYIYMRVEEFIGISLISGFLGFIFIYLITKLWPLGLFGIIIGFKIPDIFVNITKNNRIKQLSSQLPETLSILSNGLRAGFSFTQAMTVAANELDSPIKDEFSRIVRDNSIGKTLDEALMDFSERTDDEDIDMLITALIIQRKVGGNLAEILDTIGDTIRDRMRIRGEVKTLTAQGRMSAIIISLLPFGVALFIFIMNPDYIMELFKSTIGIIMVGAALVMQLVGMYIIMKMSNIEI